MHQDAPLERRIAEIATRQHGVVSRRQLVQLGFKIDAVRHRIRIGRLYRIHRGVYAVGHPSVSGHGRSLAAVLACGPGAVLSHRSAAALWGLMLALAPAIDVTTCGRTRHPRPGIAVHRPRRFDPDDRSIHDGIPVTTVARTLLDLAEVVSPRRLEYAIEAAERLGLLDLNAVSGQLNRARGRRGRARLARIVSRYREPAPTRSGLERRFVEVCRNAGLPLPAVNTSVAGFEVDALWPAQRLVVELDGYEFHRTRRAFERDRVRDAELQLASYRILRVTHRRLKDEPRAVATTIRHLLGRSAP